MLTTEAIMSLAGLTVFRKGVIYAKEGAVGHLTVGPDRVQATVQGTRPYHVTLRLDTDEPAIRCTCPAAQYQPLCKHGVAVALTYLERHPSLAEAPVDTATPAEAQLSEWLETWDKPDLVAMLMQYISANDEEWERWQLRYALAHQAVSVSEIEHYICQALPFEEAYDYEEVKAYFEHAIGMFAVLNEKLDTLEAEAAFPLLQFAYERLNTVIEDIYDKGGEAAYLDTVLASRLKAAFAQLPWGDEDKAQFIWQQQEKDWDFYLDLPEALLVTAEVERAYVQLCRRQWEALPPLAEDADWEEKRRYRRLAQRLLLEAQERGDLEQQIALQLKMATEWRDYLTLCQLSMRHGELHQAKQWMEKAQARVRHDSDRLRVLECDVALALQCQEPERAWQQQWVHFQLGQRFEHYQQLVSLAKTLGYDEGQYQRQVEAMLLLEVKKAQKKRASRAYRAENVHDTLLAFYRYHQEWQKALAWAEQQACSVSERRLLANAVLGEYPEAAMALYRQILAETVDRTNNSAYQQAVDWLLELQAALVQAQVAQAPAMVQALAQYLRQEKKAKRNLMALLNTHFPPATA